MSIKVPYVSDGEIVADAEIYWEEPNTEFCTYFAVLYVPTVGYVWAETDTRISERQRFSLDNFGIGEGWAEISRAALARLCAALVPEVLDHSNLVIERLTETIKELGATARASKVVPE